MELLRRGRASKFQQLSTHFISSYVSIFYISGYRDFYLVVYVRSQTYC